MRTNEYFIYLNTDLKTRVMAYTFRHLWTKTHTTGLNVDSSRVFKCLTQ